jgi:hypothetical protein
MPTPAKALMEQYCSVCKARYDMTVVSESSDDGVIWLKCPNCQGILPHMPDIADDASEDTATEPTPTSDEVFGSELDTAMAKAYEPVGHYAVGDVLYHRGWNDHGLVLEKQELPGGRGLLKVRFIKHGEMQLVEGAPS